VLVVPAVAVPAGTVAVTLGVAVALLVGAAVPLLPAVAVGVADPQPALVLSTRVCRTLAAPFAEPAAHTVPGPGTASAARK